MSDGPIVVTNDDGIDSPGIRALVDALAPLGEVVVVAPASNQSAVGRSIEARAAIDPHPRGYAIEGSPATCVVAAATALDLDPSMVVSGINKGANLGAPMLGRSGTIGAAVEAAYLGLPSIAVSAYVPFERIQGDFHDFAPTPDEFEPAAAVAAHLAESIDSAGSADGVDYYNVNAPLAEDLRAPVVEVTTPAPGYFTTAELDDEYVELRDEQFERLHHGDLESDADTDRGALTAGHISVSPLGLPATVPDSREREAISRRHFGDVPGRIDLTVSGEAAGR